MPNASTFGPDEDNFRQLAALLRKAINSKLNGAELARLVTLAARIALARNYLEMCAAADFQGVGKEELATSSVAELFVQCHGSLAFVPYLMECLDSDAALVARFVSIVATKAKQFLFHDLEHSDPGGFNLTRVLKGAIRSNPNIHQWPDNHPRFVTLAECHDLNPNGEAWTLEGISRLIWESGKMGDSACEWLEKVLELVVASPRHTHFIEKSLLLKAFREVNRQMIESDLVGRLKSAGPESDIMRQARRLIEQVRPLAHQLLDRQVKKGRLVKKERDCLGLALDDYLRDLHNFGEGKQSRKDYVADHWPGLIEDLYNRRFKSPFQTTLDFVHKYLRRGLRGDLG